ncbi:MAG: hypothetical protein NTY06_00715 [Candidatus Gottesmanbacteria bacterium]|nr:hypothetical protein [Candidatus Gottesmanbacteria bacterium]
MENDAFSYKKTVVVAIGITVIGTILVILHYRQISNRPGTIIIPAGNTYLGPTPTPKPPTNDTALHTVKGHIYPYTVSVPATITLITFPNDPYDMYAITGSDPASNVLIGIDAKANPSETKSTYIQNWWKQFSILTGVKSVDSFTNSKGLKGYKVKFLNATGENPSLDIFFEVPNKPQYVIHLSNGTLDPIVFANIVDSVSWEQ